MRKYSWQNFSKCSCNWLYNVKMLQSRVLPLPFPFNMHPTPAPGPIILFDGVCNLCSASVQFIIRNDKKGLFRFASLQSESGKHLLEQFGLKGDMGSVVLLENRKVYQYSTAALRIARRLDGGWPLLYGLMIVPPFIRNGVYRFIAKNRYRWFGQKQACWVPAPALQSRFLE